ncbi:hypothetical protein ACO2Q8_16705 [Larkinella sp. VNQ87]|uniref:hypothetical protein n=1 Tax=Larkinella sp. VNQ87 TaxID=3400921 RepID=UPI003C04955C
MAFNVNAIKAMIDAGIISAPPAKINTAESMRNFLKAFVDLLAAQEFTPDHEWNGTQLRFIRADGVPGNYVELKGATGAPGATGAKGDPGTLTNSAIPARTTPINRTQDKLVLQRQDGVLEKANLFQIAGGFPLVLGNLITNGNGEFGDLSNFHTGNSNLSYDPTQAPPAGGKGAFKYVGANATLRTTDFIPVNLLRRLRLSVVARHGDASGANYDAAARCYFGIACYDSEGQEIQPPHWAKVTGTQTTLAAALNTGQTTMTLTSSANWHNGATAAHRGFAWYPYTNGLGQIFPDYGYSRNISANYNAYSLGNGGAWAQGGIAGNVVTLRVPWPGPNLPAGTKVANVMEGGTYMYSSVLNNGLVPNAWTLYECYIQGINAGNSEDPANLQFRPGTAFIRPILLINYNNPAATTTFYFTMLDIREAGFDTSLILGASNAFTGANTFAGSSTFNGDVSVKRLTAAGNAPTIAAQSGAGSGASATITAGSTDMAGTLTIMMGTSPGTNVAVAVITFSSALAAAPKAILLTARSNQGAMSITRFYILTKTATSFTISSTDAAPTASTAYTYDYLVIA